MPDVDYTVCRRCGSPRAAHASVLYSPHCPDRAYSYYVAKYNGEDLDTENTDSPVCPNCGDEVADTCDIDIKFEDGATTQIECGACGLEYEIQLNVSFDWTTTKIDKS